MSTLGIQVSLSSDTLVTGVVLTDRVGWGPPEDGRSAGGQTIFREGPVPVGRYPCRRDPRLTEHTPPTPTDLAFGVW